MSQEVVIPQRIGVNGSTTYYKSIVLDGRNIDYNSDTEFLIQVGYGPKGAFTTRHRFVGDICRAFFHYTCINIGRGYKKRLLMPSSTHNPVLARATS